MHILGRLCRVTVLQCCLQSFQSSLKFDNFWYYMFFANKFFIDDVSLGIDIAYFCRRRVMTWFAVWRWTTLLLWLPGLINWRPKERSVPCSMWAEMLSLRCIFWNRIGQSRCMCMFVYVKSILFYTHSCGYKGTCTRN